MGDINAKNGICINIAWLQCDVHKVNMWQLVINGSMSLIKHYYNFFNELCSDDYVYLYCCACNKKIKYYSADKQKCSELE